MIPSDTAQKDETGQKGIVRPLLQLGIVLLVLLVCGQALVLIMLFVALHEAAFLAAAVRLLNVPAQWHEVVGKGIAVTAVLSGTLFAYKLLIIVTRTIALVQRRRQGADPTISDDA